MEFNNKSAKMRSLMLDKRQWREKTSQNHPMTRVQPRPRLRMWRSVAVEEEPPELGLVHGHEPRGDAWI